MLAEFGPDRPGGGDMLPAGSEGTAITADRARRRDLAELLGEQEPDPEIAAAARALARRLSVRLRRLDPHSDHGAGRTVPRPFRYRSDDIDLERTLPALVERRWPAVTDVVVRERVTARRDAVLVVDLSGSMRGEKVRVAAAAVAAAAVGMSGPADRLAVVAFWSDAAVPVTLGDPLRPAALLDTLLRIPARGLTNVGFGLSVARAELAGSTAHRRFAILLTDAVHNAGPDPRRIARHFTELHVLLQTDGEHDEQLGRDLARLGHGTLTPVGDHRAVPRALGAILER